MNLPSGPSAVASPSGAGTVQPIPAAALRLEASSACQLRCPSCPTTTGDTEAAVGRNFLRLADFAALVEQGLLKQDGNILAATPRGRLVLNAVIAALVD